MPMFEAIRWNIIKKIHDTPWTGHPGERSTRTLNEAIYFLPSMRDDIECYVQTCVVCQQDNVEQRQPGGLLEPLPVVERP